MVERTYHKVLSAVVLKLLHPLLAVFLSHVRLYKQFHFKCCKLNIFISNNKLINDIFHLN